ncbi:MAG: hypothetical protein K6G00_03365 [Treponema sp.]|nr:hypothetical protein [Treponema sp.]
MRKISSKAILALILCTFIVQNSFSKTKPLYKLSDKKPEKKEDKIESPILAGTDKGLIKIHSNGLTDILWNEGSVNNIIKTQTKWYFLTSCGIFYSNDLVTFYECNKGLPSLVIKTYEQGEKRLINEVPLLKDLCVDPFDENILVTATKDAVFLTRDGGSTWKSIGSMSRATAGMKAVACAHMPVYNNNGEQTGTELVVFMSHPIYGFSYYRADAAKPTWIDVSAGFSAMPSLTQPDEVSDILPVIIKNATGNVYVDIYIANTFLPNLYRFDWKKKAAVKIYSGTQASDTIDGLCQSNGKIVFTTVGSVSSIELDSKKITPLPEKEYSELTDALEKTYSSVYAAYIPEDRSGLGTPLQLSELWLLKPDTMANSYCHTATDKKAVYISAYQVRNQTGIDKYKKIIANNNLNALVVDMKDDYGLLRFEPNNELLKQKGTVTQYKIDLDHFVEEFKKDNTYLIGRIVVFKDKRLASYAGGKYAVWDRENKKAWMGIRGTEDILDDEGNVTETKTLYYDENWVDPYSEEVWEYNVEIAKELIARGFDEIQFDYIRFPTDGTNLYNASFRWKDEGMDKEAALISFLSYARKNINAPIGIDIYGANGWYRSGTRTGQDVELLSNYVDVICPMFYPSHFEQDFLEYNPVVERPYRIYFFGTYRNTIIGRNKIIVRPWVQAFYMGVRYDRKYYDKNYVLREIYGVRDSVNRGYMYWNNSGGNYEDISPDIGDSVSPWVENEADLQERLPAFSSGKKVNAEEAFLQKLNAEKEHRKAMISILDSLWEKEYEYKEKTRSEPSQNISIHLLNVGHLRPLHK